MAQTRTSPRPRQNKTERLARDRLIRNLRAFEADSYFEFTLHQQIPDAWATLEEDVDVEEKKTKVTLYLDESVAKFYRALGKGYQARVNRVLATYAQLKISNVRAFEAFRAEKEREERERWADEAQADWEEK
mgnify:CR=1 FL=1